MKFTIAALIAFHQVNCLETVEAPSNADVSNFAFATHLAKFGKTYTTVEEFTLRRNNFLEADAKIQEHNAEHANGLHSYTLGHNQFSTWTTAEFEATLGLLMSQDSMPEDAEEKETLAGLEGVEASLLQSTLANFAYGQASGTYKTFDDSDLPDSLDWRDKGAVTPIQDQGNCGSCWTFMTAGVVEGAVQIAGNELVNLSEQQILDCTTTKQGSQGCSGGYMDSGFEYLMEEFAILETDYPYVSGTTGVKTDCQYDDISSKTDIEVTAWYGVIQYNGTQMKAALATGPVGIMINANTTTFMYYTGGIFDCSSSDCSDSSSALDHAVLLVGYGTDSGTEYFILKNSWGTTWGDEGYMKIVNEGTGNGESGMFIAPVIANTTGGTPSSGAMAALAAGFSTLILGTLALSF